jgi:pimeloyl-ACP methyl ester carboxylesterase
MFKKGDGMAATSQLCAADGTTIAWHSLGTGPGLVLVSGAMLAGADYTALAELLADRYTVHLLDRRGRGGSGPQGDRYGMDTECTDLTAVLRATGARQVFGHSYGGLVAMQTALREPALVDRLALFEPAVSIDGSLPRWFLPEFRAAIDRRRWARAMTLLLRGLQLGGPFDRLPLPVATAVAGLLLHTAGRSMRQALPTVPAEVAAGIALDGPADRYAPVSTPTLLLTGERGPGYLATAAAALATALPAARHVVLPGADHGAPQQAPRLVAGALAPFLVVPAEV